MGETMLHGPPGQDLPSLKNSDWRVGLASAAVFFITAVLAFGLVFCVLETLNSGQETKKNQEWASSSSLEKSVMLSRQLHTAALEISRQLAQKSANANIKIPLGKLRAKTKTMATTKKKNSDLVKSFFSSESRSGRAASVSLVFNATVDELSQDQRDLSSNFGPIYTPWGRWSKCRRKNCKQVRKRYCAVPPICGSNVLREERPCPRHRQKQRCRRRRRNKGSHQRNNNNFHIVKRRKLSRKTRGMLKFNRAFYSRWSKWSACSDSCKTSRTRSCKFSLVCGSSAVHEEAYCYTDGSLCHQLFRQGKSLTLIDKYRDGDLDPDVSESWENRVSSRTAQDTPLRPPLHQPQCGVRVSEAGAATAASTSSKTSPPSWALKIIGGREATRGNWPWQVAIMNKYKEVFCGGTIVAPGWILTAAHCVRKHLYIRLGEHDLVIKEGSEREFFVEHSVLHPDYDPDTVDNDVALLRIPYEEAEHQDHGSLVENAACLPHPGQPLPANGAKCTIIGWGKEKNSHVYGTDVLHEAEIPIVSKSSCLNVYKDYYITDNMFCAGYKNGRIDSCAGDSGGPLLCDDGGHWTIFGVTSFGEGCGKEGKFGIYAQVPNYVHWIDEVINYKRR